MPRILQGPLQNLSALKYIFALQHQNSIYLSWVQDVFETTISQIVKRYDYIIYGCIDSNAFKISDNDADLLPILNESKLKTSDRFDESNP